MASPTQITANLRNSPSSTGPTSAEGKARSARNATKFGLFAARDFVPEGARLHYDTFRESLLEQLNPASALESVLANEIVSASWRLERCAQIEADLAQQPAQPQSEQTQPEQTQPTIAALERARTAATRALWRHMAELRKLQNERITRVELKVDKTDEGLATTPEIYKGLSAPGMLAKAAKLHSQTNFMRMLTQPHRPLQAPRNSLCTCGSGIKYKRCCGNSAPAVRTASSAT